jgi:FkbM family methyltransferase
MGISTLTRVVRSISNHPLNKDDKIKATINFIKWNIGIRLVKSSIIFNWVEDSKLVIKQGMSGATGSIYTGLFEFHDMAFLLHLLREDDMFYDIGANVGVYSVLASAVSGAQTKSFEPIPYTFQHLRTNVIVNEISDKVKLYNCGIGRSETTLSFTNSLDATSHVIEGNDNSQNSISVKSVPIDTIETDKTPILLKIDVEGFESEVLAGAPNLLKDTALKAIIIELNGLGARYNFKDDDIHELLLGHGFLPYEYLPFQRKLKKLDIYNHGNTIYIRNEEFVMERLVSAKKVKVHGKVL